uniref:DRBM domain-containing protein n=1 Tax=Strigamia maritima TaxID=126957 RepID=T1J2M6_STRMM
MTANDEKEEINSKIEQLWSEEDEDDDEELSSSLPVNVEMDMNSENLQNGMKRKRDIFYEDVDENDEVDEDSENESDIKKICYENRMQNVEYDVIDEFDMSKGDSYQVDESSASEYDDIDIPEDEIDAMLDEGLNNRKKCEHFDDDFSHEEREKVVLRVLGHDHFEVLPEGWIEVTHNSGMPVYLHKQTRVCTLSKPYFLGPGSARKHEIPITAIPCLHYKREIAKEKAGDSNEAFEEGTNSTNISDDSKPTLPNAKIETVIDNNKEKSLAYLQVREYCQKLFEFQTITVRRFKTWAGRRKHQKMIKQLQRPTLPASTKLITCPLPVQPDKDEAAPTKPRREFTMNPNGKSHVCILHEYVQHAMRLQPKYIFNELENANQPYGATVIISDMRYGTGYGSSKKQAKSEAAKATLEILIPQMKDVNPEDQHSLTDRQELAFFDEVRVEDPRVSELCAKAGQPSPYQILLECLKRNYGMGDTNIKLEMHTLKHQKNEFTMSVGKHKAKVICKNKRDGKQRASQAILQAMHSHILTWGSLLRLYGKGSCKTLKEKKQEEQQITELQSRASANKPNQSILNKLKEEMLKLKVQKDSIKPIGKFQTCDMDLPPSSASNLNNVDL